MKNARMERRAFLTAGALAAGALAGLAGRARAESHDAALGQGAGDGYVMSSGVVRHCATCEFWGGPRRLAADGKTLTVTGLGWCNNPQSPNYQKMTSPEHGPMSVWRKWQAIP
jgi:hypothetical protein